MYVCMYVVVYSIHCIPAACNELLSVSQTHDTFHMFADSEKDMDSWIDAINRVLYEVMMLFIHTYIHVVCT